MTGGLDSSALPALAQVAEADLVTELLAEASGLAAEEAGAVSWVTTVLKDKPGRRCTIRYDAPRSDGSTLAVIGKFYAQRRKAAEAYRLAEKLRRALGEDERCLPEPLLAAPELGLFLQEAVDGLQLEAVPEQDRTRSFALAARWLARLHGAAPIPRLGLKPLQHELQKAEGWAEEVASFLPAPALRVLRSTQERIHALTAEMSPPQPAMIHRDFYYANVLWDGRRIWVLDLDQLSIGDPAMDVGHFLAHIEKLSYFTTGRFDSLALWAERFLEPYLRESALELHPRSSFFKAYTHLKLAATETQRRETGWRRRSRAFAVRAGHVVDEARGE